MAHLLRRRNLNLRGSKMYEAKTIPEFPSYSVDTGGNIYSHLSNKYLKPQVNPNGYFTVGLREGGGTCTKTVHRLEARAHLKGSGEGLDVNHLDGDKLNNKIENLEWATRSENIRHAFSIGLSKITTRKPVRAIGVCGVIEFPSVVFAGDCGFDRRHIHKCIKAPGKLHKGYRWEFIK
jgi:hypothetical protein